MGHYPAPNNRMLRWIAAIGDDLPDEVQSRLRANFLTSKGPLVVGAVNGMLLAVMAYSMTSRPVFLLLWLCDFVLLLFRLVLLGRPRMPTGPLFATGLIWAALQAATITLVVSSGNLVLSMIVMASGFAAIGGIMGRNFAAPRYAMTQVMLIDASFKIPFAWLNPQFLPLLAFQSVLFIMMNIGLLRQHRSRAIAAIEGELASRQQAFTDPLTGLGNRRWMEERFSGLSHRVDRRALLYLDLDGFKAVNDRLGHAAGDRLLQLVGERLAERCGPEALVCRLGGDEFLVLLNGATASDAKAVGAGIAVSVAVPFEIEPNVLARVGASVGIAVDDGENVPLAELMARADKALYAAKTHQKGSCVLYGDNEPRSTSAPPRRVSVSAAVRP